MRWRRALIIESIELLGLLIDDLPQLLCLIQHRATNEGNRRVNRHQSDFGFQSPIYHGAIITNLNVTGIGLIIICRDVITNEDLIAGDNKIAHIIAGPHGLRHIIHIAIIDGPVRIQLINHTIIADDNRFVANLAIKHHPPCVGINGQVIFARIITDHLVQVDILPIGREGGMVRNGHRAAIELAPFALNVIGTAFNDRRRILENRRLIGVLPRQQNWIILREHLPARRDGAANRAGTADFNHRVTR